MTELHGFPFFGGEWGIGSSLYPYGALPTWLGVKFLVLGCFKLNARRRKYVNSWTSWYFFRLHESPNVIIAFLSDHSKFGGNTFCEGRNYSLILWSETSVKGIPWKSRVSRVIERVVFLRKSMFFLNLIGQFCRDNLAVTLQLSFRRFPSLKKTYSLNWFRKYHSFPSIEKRKLETKKRKKKWFLFQRDIVRSIWQLIFLSVFYIINSELF